MKTRGRMITAVLVIAGSANLLFAQNTVQANAKNTTSFLQDTTRATEYFNKGKELAKAAQYDSSNAYYLKARGIYEKLGKQHERETLWEKSLKCSNNVGWNLIIQARGKNFGREAMRTKRTRDIS